MKDFKIVWSARSECGPNRKKNEDTIFPAISGSSKPPFKAWLANLPTTTLLVPTPGVLTVPQDSA